MYTSFVFAMIRPSTPHLAAVPVVPVEPCSPFSTLPERLSPPAYCRTFPPPPAFPFFRRFFFSCRCF